MLRIILVYLSSTLIIQAQHSPPRKKIIIDTDLFSDVDDAGALLLACTHDNFPIDLLALNVNYPSTYTALAASSILGYYNHAHVPIGLPRPFSNDTFFDDYMFQNGEYASKVAYHWRETSDLSSSIPWNDVSEKTTWDPVVLYRKTLAGEGEDSVTIVSIGFLDNLSKLLSSLGDQYSPLSGKDLVASRVTELVIMGGMYPSGKEFNFFGYNSSAAAHVVNTWPGRIVFSGGELGAQVYSGARLTIEEGLKGDPVAAAYRWYNGYNASRSSWDPLTMLYAIQGLGDVFRFGNEAVGGYNYVFPDGSNEWRETGDERPDYEQFYLRLAITETEAGKILDDLFIRGAKRAASTTTFRKGYCRRDHQQTLIHSHPFLPECMLQS